MMTLNHWFLIMINVISIVVGYKMRVTMPGVIPDHDDEYLCSSFKITDPDKVSYIKSYESTTNSSVAHHILLYGCKRPFSTEPYYSCARICESGHEKILFAWAKDARKFEYPSDTGMAVSGKTEIFYLVLQVHYLKRMEQKDVSGMEIQLSYKPPANLVSIVLVFSYYGDIPANSDHVNMDISCSYRGKIPAYPLAFRTHTHALGRLISGYRVGSNGQIDLIGKANPQWPQTFYRANSNVMIMPGDILMARCVFDSTGKDQVTSIGPNHSDEMCNFYIMLVTKSSEGKLDFDSCGGNEFEDLWKNVPNYSKEYGAAQPNPDLLLTSARTQALVFDSKWKVEYTLGEVSSVSILHESMNSSKYSLIIFHRVDRYWDQNSFKDNVYIGDKSAISAPTILDVNPVNGKVTRKGGANLFFMPHGITATKDGKFIWLTDVALHQVMRFTVRPRGDEKLMNEKPDMIFGERFVPGNDRDHFCKPSKVAVDSKGFIFVSDGYCNSRVVWFYPNGTYGDEWRTKDMMIVVHSITIDEHISGDSKKNIVWVADRENQRIVGFRYNGRVAFISSSTQYAMPIYAIEFNSLNGRIYGVSTNGLTDGDSFVVNTKMNAFTEPWHSDYQMKAPHDLCLAEDGNVIFVAELHLKTVVKFSNGDHKVDQDELRVVKHFITTHDIIVKMSPTLIGLAVFLVILCILFCLFLVRLFNRYTKRGNKKKGYGRKYKDKEGFEPLNQNDDNEDGGDSDPETEEFSAPLSRLTKKPKA